MEHEAQDGVGDPAQAFEDLQAEVSVMRRAVEALPRALAANQPPPPPDYRSDIGKVTQVLVAVAGRLDAIEKHPALRLTPEQHRQAIASAGSELMRDAAGKLNKATQDHERARVEVAGMIGSMRGQDKQFWAMVWMGGIALAVGLILSPLLASVLPFGLNTRVAALVMNNDRWDAGWALLRAADQNSAQDASAGLSIVRDNRAVLVACQEEVARNGNSQNCNIVMRWYPR